MSLISLSWLKNSVITEVIFAVMPIVVFLFAFQFLIMKRPVENSYHIDRHSIIYRRTYPVL